VNSMGLRTTCDVRRDEFRPAEGVMQQQCDPIAASANVCATAVIPRVVVQLGDLEGLVRWCPSQKLGELNGQQIQGASRKQNLLVAVCTPLGRILQVSVDRLTVHKRLTSFLIL
jgi:hypothetical protein